MPLTVPFEVKEINRHLIDHFGIDTSTGQPMWRVVWSEDQYEHRLSDRTPEGLQLIHPQVQYLPKYRQWLPNKWVLERLVAIPDMNEKELPATKLSYEPIYPFEDRNGNALPPKFEACKFAIDLIYAATGKKSMAKYVDPDLAPGAKEERINKLQAELFGDENEVTDALAYREGVSVPHNYNGNKES